MSKTITKMTLGLIAATTVSSPVFADGNNQPRYLAEVDSCVQELVNRIDTQEVSRIRHVVTGSRKSGIGYALDITTTVFREGGVSTYAVYCVADGNDTPIKFRVKELNG